MRVVFAPEADADLAGILDYIAKIVLFRYRAAIRCGHYRPLPQARPVSTPRDQPGRPAATDFERLGKTSHSPCVQSRPRLQSCAFVTMIRVPADGTRLMDDVRRVQPALTLQHFKPYPAYRDSGVGWLGDIPTHWGVKPLKAILIRNDSGVWGDDLPDGGTIVLRSTEQTIGGQWLIDNPARRMLTAREVAQARLEVDDLVVTKSSGSGLHIGKTFNCGSVGCRPKLCLLQLHATLAHKYPK
jgi:hypothetical protein